MNTNSTCIYRFLAFYTCNTTMKRGRKGVNTYMRPLCTCGQRPAAVNYKKNNKTYYRSLCEVCLTHGIYHGIPRWSRAGYKLKSQCDKCGFKSIHPEVYAVFHVDGDLNNCRHPNLKTVCANCQRILHKLKLPWRQGDLRPDF
jgi:hypothetical protein